MMYKYRLQFDSPLHIGLESIGQERIETRPRSDTMWGAIIQKWLLLYDEDPDVLCSASPFQISSCFPYFNSQYLYPVPLRCLDHLVREASASGSPPVDTKSLKKIKFVAEPLFLQLLEGVKADFSDLHPAAVYPSPSRADAGDKGLSLSEEAGFITFQRPRLQIDQLTGGPKEGGFFYCTDQYFRHGPKDGLFFLATFDNKESKTRFDASLRLLGDSGIGADRSVGRGFFEFEDSPYSLPEIEDARAYLLLSLYRPSRAEIQNGILESEIAAYSLVQRTGHAGAPGVHRFRRCGLWMLEEGAVLPERPEGTITCVLEESDLVPHKVYRYGRAFCVPICQPPRR